MSMLQDLYPDDFAHCYGCGRLNTNGLHVKSEWTDGEAIARFKPAPYHMALPGFVYGGLIASLPDGHAIAAAAAASMVAANATENSSLPASFPKTRRSSCAPAPM